MEGIMITGGSLCFLGLVLGAMTGAIAMLLIPAAAGMLILGAASWYKQQLERKAEAWRTTYPPYKY